MTFTPQDTAAYNTVQNNVTITVTSGGGTTNSLNGVWQTTNGTIITINGSTGSFTQFGSLLSTVWKSAVDKNLISIGSPMYRNLTKTGDLTWTGQEVIINYETSSPNVAAFTTWSDTTITLSADGQTFIEGGTLTWTRQ
jgi:hypothetical protein